MVKRCDLTNFIQLSLSKIFTSIFNSDIDVLFCLPVVVQDKKKVAEKKQKKADKELKKAEARNPSVQVPIGLDRTPLEYGQQLNAKQLHNVKYEKNRKNLEQWKRDTETKFIEKRYTDFFGQERHKTVVDFSSSNRVNRRPPYYVGEWIEPGSVEVEPSHESVLSSEPVFRNKIEEDIWRLKNKK